MTSMLAGPLIKLQCMHCNKNFMRSEWQHNSNIKRGRKSSFCSQKCAKDAEKKKRKKKPLLDLPSNKYTESTYRQNCIQCGKKAISIIETRKNSIGHVYRRKECNCCEIRYTTMEIPKELYDQVFKKKNNHIKINCADCNFSINNKCSFDLPEYNTTDSYDCIHYESD